ncbi:MAG TPA: hypothetical protein VG738_22550 [Chitinophagaceae bacterium]|nr:hypothetical protein [Chitinophagaceae bacterium]
MTLPLTTLVPGFFHPFGTLCHSIPFAGARLAAGIDKDDYLLEYVCPGDLPLLQSWHTLRYPHSKVAAYNETEEMIALAGHVQSFILRYLRYPVFHLSVFEAGYYGAGENDFQALPGDYLLQFNNTPLDSPVSLRQAGLSLFMKYCFSFPEVLRLLYRVNQKDTERSLVMHHLLESHGFQPCNKDEFLCLSSASFIF